jgi:hypothetical protein
MRSHEIFELAGAKVHTSRPIETVEQLEDYMETLGFSMLSGGEFSLVFENPRVNEVVKVYNDECYDRFISFCKAHRNNPCLPRFRGNGVRLNEKARMIRIERLSETTSEEQRAAGLHTLVSIASKPQADFEQWDFSPEQQLFLDTLQELHSQKGGCWVDLNSGNIMKRGDQFVIVDPYAPDRDGWGSTRTRFQTG